MYITKPLDKDIIPERLTLYTTALCNLKCSYCYICKDNTNALKKIDDDIKVDWENNNYIKRLKYDFPKEYLENIKGIDLWGGETLIGMDRFTKSFHNFKEILPNLNFIQFSTNFVAPHTLDILKRLIDEISKNISIDEIFTIYLQISVDGPEDINDLNRGKGVTEKILKNYNDFLDINIPSNIQVCISTKPTLSRDTFESFLDYDYVKRYYFFFNDNFYKPFLNKSDSKINSVFCGIPNYAEPFNYSVADGVMLTSVFKVFQEVGKKEEIPAFEGRSLVPYVSRFNFNKKNFYNPINYICGGACGKLVYDITMVPHDKYCVCHRSLFDAYVDYSNTKVDNTEMNYDEYMTSQRATLSKEDYIKLRKAIVQSYLYPTKQIGVDMDTMIKLNAKAGLILPKYLNAKERLPVVNFMETSSMCLDSNYRLQGSLFCQPFWWIRLFLNGAFDIMMEEVERCHI